MTTVRVIPCESIGPYAISVWIECDPGGAPRLTMHALSGEMTRAQWTTVRDAIDEAWRELAVRCRCGHPFSAHSDHSPHGCWGPSVSGCSCRSFSAAEPLHTETKP